MTYQYMGNYPFNKLKITTFAPDSQGVYYCGFVKLDGSLGTLYVGRAKGTGVTIKSRLHDHFNYDRWGSVTHFGYILCTTDQDAINLEAYEIRRLQPTYNKNGK